MSEEESNPPLLEPVTDETPESVEGLINASKQRKKSTKKKISVWDLITRKSDRKALYVLFICSIVYMFNQVDRYLIAVTSKEIQKSQNWGDGDGGGSDYDFLVGPVFTVVYLPAGIPMAMLADRISAYRHYLLGVSLIVWSLSVIWTGFSQSYGEIVASRFVLAFAESACTPLACSIITDHFRKEARATALGIYNWGIYLGYSLALGVGNALTSFAGWRCVWWTFGFSGIVWALFVFTLPMKVKSNHFLKSKKESINSIRKSSNKSNSIDNNSINNSINNNNSFIGNLKYYCCHPVVLYFVKSPSIMLLLIGSLIRNAGGYVWAFNTKIFFENRRNQGHLKQAVFMGWIPLLCGSLGSVFGGYISDKYVQNSSSIRRLIILILSNLCAAPFAFLALIIPQAGWPAFYLALIPSNIIGEMWVGVTLTIVVELVPKNMKTTGLSIYFFVIGLAGFIPELVTPFTKLFNSYLWALVILFPGLYVLSSVLFLLAFLFVEKDKRRAILHHKKSSILLEDNE